MNIPDQQTCVLALSGRTKSGKSSIADLLKEELDWPCASFGDYVRSVAEQKDMPTTRESLQDLGAELIVTLGWESFCMHMLNHSGLDARSAPCIIEGVRHLDALHTLRKLFSPVSVHLVHLEVSDEERDRRLQAEGISSDRGAAWESHSTERDVAEALPALADLVLPITSSPDATVGAVLEWLRSV